MDLPPHEASTTAPGPRPFLLRLLAWCGAVLAVQLVVGTATLPEDLQALDEALDGGADVLFLADSTNRAFDPADADRRWISQILATRLASATDGPAPVAAPVVAALDHAAYHPLVYRDLVTAVARHAHRPRAMVFVLNTRAFLPGWAMRPGWQFERLRFSLAHPWLARLWQPLAVFRWVDASSVSEVEFRTAPVRIGRESAGVVGDYLRGDPEALDTPQLLDEDLRLRLTCNYLGAIREEDERLVAMVDAVTRCRELGITPVVYVTPVDVDTGEGLLPGRFRAAVVANAELLTSRLRSAGAVALDLATTLPTGRFSWQRIPNEHLDEAGRASVAEALAAVMAPLLIGAAEPGVPPPAAGR